MLVKIKSLIKKLNRMIPRSLIAKVKILACHKKLFMGYMILVSVVIIGSHYGLSYFNLDFISPLEVLGAPLCTPFIPAASLWMFGRDKVKYFRMAIANGDIKKISLFIESDLNIEKVKEDIWAELIISEKEEEFWGYASIFGIEFGPRHQENLKPKNLDSEVTRYLLNRWSDNMQLNDRQQFSDRITKISEEIKKLLEFANQKAQREVTDRALVYSTNYHSTKLQPSVGIHRKGLPNDMIHQVLTFSDYPKTSDTIRLRQYEIEDALHNSRPRVNNICNRIMSWLL